jgi:AAA domain
MARIILVFGWPGHGKSTLSKTLAAAHGFHRLDVDAIYVQFVRTQYQQSCPPNIDQVILGHYDDFFSKDDTRRRGWHEHFLGQIVTAADQHRSIVVEGYLLGDCRTAFDRTLTAQGHRVLHIRAEWHTYTDVGPGLTMQEVAASSTLRGELARKKSRERRSPKTKPRGRTAKRR